MVFDITEAYNQLNESFTPITTRAQNRAVSAQDKLYGLLEKIAQYKDYQKSEPSRRASDKANILKTQEMEETSPSRVGAEISGNKFAGHTTDAARQYEIMQTINDEKEYEEWYKTNKDFAKQWNLKPKYDDSNFKEGLEAIKNSVEHMRDLELARVQGSSRGSSGNPMNQELYRLYQMYDMLEQQAVAMGLNEEQTAAYIRQNMSRIKRSLIRRMTSTTDPGKEDQLGVQNSLIRSLQEMTNPNPTSPGALPGISGGYDYGDQYGATMPSPAGFGKSYNPPPIYRYKGTDPDLKGKTGYYDPSTGKFYAID